MHTRGAIIRQAPGTYEVVDLEVEDPRQGEIQVEMTASGLCHSDDHIATGDIPVGMYPFCGGHEGAGVVSAVGPHTQGWKEGDHVVFSFLPSCGQCTWCSRGMQNLCDLGATLLMGSRWAAACGWGPVGAARRAAGCRTRGSRSGRCAASRRSPRWRRWPWTRR